MTLAETCNPCLAARQQVLDLADVDFDTTQHKRPIPEQRRLALLWRKQNAAAAVKDLDHHFELYGFTKGQFSLLDLMQAILTTTGPANVALSTWTASRDDAIALTAMHKDGLIRSMRWLVDLTFQRRDPEAAQIIRKTFGMDSIRIALCHAKFCLFGNSDWNLVLRTSMNLNHNARTEDFTVADDPALYSFLETILAKVWVHLPGSLANHRPYDVHKLFGALN